MEERQHHLRESSSAGLRRSQKLEILPSLNSRVWAPTFVGAYIFYRPRRFQRPPCYCRILCDANILDVAQIFYVCAIFWIGANVMDANISWTQTFHGRKHFMGANISWAQTFHGREYFMGANISRARIFWDVRIHF